MPNVQINVGTLSLRATTPSLDLSFLSVFLGTETPSTRSVVNTTSVIVGTGSKRSIAASSMRGLVNSVTVNTTTVLLLAPEVPETRVTLLGRNTITQELEGPLDKDLNKSVPSFERIIPELVKVQNDVTRLPPNYQTLWSQDVISDLSRVRATEVVRGTVLNYAGQALVQDRLAITDNRDSSFDASFLVDL